MFRGRADAWRPVGADGNALRTPTCYAVGIEPFSAVVWRASYVAGACNDGTTRCDRSALRMDAPGGALDQASTRPPLRSSVSMPSSWILRVSVLRPQPSHAPLPCGGRRCARARGGSASSRIPSRADRRRCARRAPAPARARGRAPAASRLSADRSPAPGASRTSGGRSATSTRCPGAITVSQWQMFSSWRTLPGNANACSAFCASSDSSFGSTASSRALFCRKCRASGPMSSGRSRSGGSRRRTTLSRCSRSSRNRPEAHALLEVLVRRRDDAHARLAAARGRRRGSTRRPRARAAGAPAGRAACRRSRRGTACRPRPARSARGASACAPVNAPRSWPKSSDSSRSFGIAAVLIATNGPRARGLCRCSARATSSLPVPDSPVISTVAFDCDRRPIARNTSCIAGAWPSISGVSAADGAAACRRRRLGARAADQRERVVDVERLRQVLERAALERRHRAVEVRVRGHDDHRHVRIALLDLVEQREARFARHADVGDQHLRLADARAPASPRTPTRTSCTECLRARAPSRAPSESSGRRRRSTRPSSASPRGGS